MIKIICRHRLESGESCNTLLASTNGQQIYFDGKPFPYNPRKLYFDCPNCSSMIKWHSKDKSMNFK